MNTKQILKIRYIRQNRLEEICISRENNKHYKSPER